MIPITVHVSAIGSITRMYAADDVIWKVEEAKRERKVIADIQREIVAWTDFKAKVQVTERG
jgi:hypothetical protein